MCWEFFVVQNVFDFNLKNKMKNSLIGRQFYFERRAFETRSPIYQKPAKKKKRISH